MSSELKPCPFCEGVATGPWESSPDGDVCRISCQSCGAAVFDTALDRCVARWNRRWNSLLVYGDTMGRLAGLVNAPIAGLPPEEGCARVLKEVEWLSAELAHFRGEHVAATLALGLEFHPYKSEGETLAHGIHRLFWEAGRLRAKVREYAREKLYLALNDEYRGSPYDRPDVAAWNQAGDALMRDVEDLRAIAEDGECWFRSERPEGGGPWIKVPLDEWKREVEGRENPDSEV